jgi:Zn-finger nucleic acid-binding protein
MSERNGIKIDYCTKYQEIYFYEEALAKVIKLSDTHQNLIKNK